MTLWEDYERQTEVGFVGGFILQTGRQLFEVWEYMKEGYEDGSQSPWPKHNDLWSEIFTV